MFRALRAHWPEYLMEAVGLAMFMASACFFVALLAHPGSPIAQRISPSLALTLIGIAMGLTAVGIIYSPWGRRSGAHLNPSVTLTFFRLGKVAPWDAFFYVVAQFVGGLAGVALMAALLGSVIANPSVNYVVTVPGPDGTAVAFVAEVVISFGLMLMVLIVTNTSHFAGYTGLCAGVLVAVYISVEAPLSGMSMNPARTFGSALPAQVWTAMWIYFIAPPLGMLAAAEVYVRIGGARGVFCAKLHHDNSKRCIFRCGYRARGAKVPS